MAQPSFILPQKIRKAVLVMRSQQANPSRRYGFVIQMGRPVMRSEFLNPRTHMSQRGLQRLPL
jgi:hypothetical protein